MATELDKVNNGALATLIAVVALGVIGVALAVTALTRQQVSVHQAEKEGTAQVEHAALLKSQREALAQGMPIDAAMQTLVRELAKNPRSASPPASAQPAAAGAAGAAAVAGAGAGGGSGGAATSSAAGGTGGKAAPSAPGTAGAAGGATRSSGGAPAMTPIMQPAAGGSPKSPRPATPTPAPSGPPSAHNHGP
jgi:hypothetical protein